MDYIEKMLGSLIESCTPFALKLVAAILILIIGSRLIKWGLKKISGSKFFAKLEKSLASFLLSFIKIGLYIVLVLTLGSVLGIPMTSFITILASAGVAVGLALQGALSNFAGGVMLLLFRPFKVGDYISASGAEGIVKDITIIYTVITTPDNKRITVPNGALMNASVTNFSAEDMRRVDMTFAVSAANDAEKVKKLLLDLAKSNEKVLKDPAPFARMSAQGGEYTLRMWCNSADYWTVYYDITEQAKVAFEKNGIEK